MAKYLHPISASGLLALLVACGGGSSTGNTPAPVLQSTSMTSVASASAGEVISLTYDLTALTFSWTTLKSSYLDLASSPTSAYSGSGTLAKENPTSARYVMTDTTTATVMGTLTPAENGTVIARLALPVLNTNPVTLGGQTVTRFGSAGPLQSKITVPVLGVRNPTTTASDVSGTYNFISISCSAKSNGFPFQTANVNGSAAGVLWNSTAYVGHTANVFSDGLCKTNYGTVKIIKGPNEQTASIEYCNKQNMTNAACTSSGHGTGTATYDPAKKVWLFLIDGSSVEHAAVTFKSASNDQKVGWIDTNGGALGYGQMVMAEQTIPTLSDLNGVYFGENASFTTNSHTICGSGSSVTMDGVAAFTMNSPWQGFGSMDASPKVDRITSELSNAIGAVPSTIALMAGAGVYVSRSTRENFAPYAPTPWGFEIGTRVGTATCP